MTAQLETGVDTQEQARKVYRQSLAAEMPVTGARLGAMFNRSPRWGRSIIAEVKAADGIADIRQAPPTSGTREAAAETAVIPAVRQPERQPERQAAEHAAEPAAKELVTAPISAATAAVEAEAAALPQRSGAKAVAWFAFVFGVVVSVAANVAHTFHPTEAQLHAWSLLPHPAGAQWQPEVGAQLAAAFWPVALLLAVEVLSRVRWRSGWTWMLARFGGTGAVALVAAVMSYRHMQGLLTAYGEDQLSASLGPLAVDGLMVVAGFALLTMGEKNEAKA